MLTSATAPPKDNFALFVRAVEGRVVRRFGTPNQIGHAHDPGDKATPAGQKWDTETIFPITVPEMLRHGREYRREIADGGLREATRQEWEQQRAARKAAHKAAVIAAEAVTKAELAEQAAKPKAVDL